MSNKTMEVNNMSEEKSETIINTLHGLKYDTTEFKEHIALPLAQWLCDSGFDIETTMMILTAKANIDENVVSTIFQPNAIPLHSLSDLQEFLTHKEFQELEKAIKPVKKVNKCKYDLDEDTFVDIDFINKKISQVKKYTLKDGTEDTKRTSVIEAVPKNLIIYDSDFVDLPRSFKIIWESKFSNRNFLTAGDGTGANIKDIEKSLIESGYSHTHRLVHDTLSCAINAMIQNGLADVRDTIDNKGIYYNIKEDTLIPVKMNLRNPSDSEIIDALDLLSELRGQYITESDTFMTVMKWSMMSIFSYAMKQAGKFMPWLYLVGVGRSGKTTLGKIGTYIYSEPSIKNNLGGSSFNSDYRIGRTISQDCTFRIINEPAATFKNEDLIETIKNSVELTICRIIQGKHIPAFSPVIFTANTFVPEVDALYRRLFIINFDHDQRKSKEKGKVFENNYKVDSPSKSPLKKLNVIGLLAVAEVLKDTGLLYMDWQDAANQILTKIYEHVGLKIPSWALEWASDKELDDLDNMQVENIRGVLINELNNARNRVNVHGDYDSINEYTYTNDTNHFKKLYWKMFRERMFDWAVPFTKSDERYLFLNNQFKTMINKYSDDSSSLKSIAQLVGWKYGRKQIAGKRSRGIIVSLQDFIEFVYPSVGDDE